MDKLLCHLHLPDTVPVFASCPRLQVLAVANLLTPVLFKCVPMCTSLTKGAQQTPWWWCCLPEEVSAPGSTAVLHNSTEELVQLLQQGPVDYPPFSQELMQTWHYGFPQDPTEASWASRPAGQPAV
jgi:hypothetical protein